MEKEEALRVVVRKADQVDARKVVQVDGGISLPRPCYAGPQMHVVAGMEKVGLQGK